MGKIEVRDFLFNKDSALQAGSYVLCRFFTEFSKGFMIVLLAKAIKDGKVKFVNLFLNYKNKYCNLTFNSESVYYPGSVPILVDTEMVWLGSTLAINLLTCVEACFIKNILEGRRLELGSEQIDNLALFNRAVSSFCKFYLIGIPFVLKDKRIAFSRAINLYEYIDFIKKALGPYKAHKIAFDILELKQRGKYCSENHPIDKDFIDFISKLRIKS